MITPATFDLTKENCIGGVEYPSQIIRGADFVFDFVIDIDGTSLDLTGATVSSQIRKSKKRTSSPPIADFTVTVTNGDEAYLSNIALTLTDTETAAITAGDGFYDVLVVDSSGNDVYYVEGRVEIDGSVTVKA